MSDPTFSDIDLKNKMVRVWTTLKLSLIDRQLFEQGVRYPVYEWVYKEALFEEFLSGYVDFGDSDFSNQQERLAVTRKIDRDDSWNMNQNWIFWKLDKMSQLKPPCIRLQSMIFIMIDLKVWNTNIGGILFKFEIISIRFFTWCAREHFLVDLKIFSTNWKLIKPFWKTKLTLLKKFSKARIHWQQDLKQIHGQIIWFKLDQSKRQGSMDL